MEAALHGQPYNFIVAEPYRWTTWAAPRAANGQIDYHRALTGDDLRESRVPRVLEGQQLGIGGIA